MGTVGVGVGEEDGVGVGVVVGVGVGVAGGIIVIYRDFHRAMRWVIHVCWVENELCYWVTIGDASATCRGRYFIAVV